MLLDRLAKRYGQRPSKLAGLIDSALAVDFDLAVMLRGEAEEVRVAKEQQQRQREQEKVRKARQGR